MAVDLTPTEGMASAASRGLELHEQGLSGDGLKPETVARAGRLSRREEMNEDWVREMNAWFARHESSKSPGWNEPPDYSPAYVAWLLWGGDAGQSFSARKVEELDRENERSAPMDAVIERRDWVFEDEDALVIEKRSDGRPVISGYAVKWNSLSVDMGGFRERFLPGAFDKVLSRSYKKADPIALFNHDPSIVLGRASSGTLEVKADDKGLAYRIFPPTTRADIVELVERGDVRGASFAFTVEPKGEAWGPDDSGKPLRSISEASGLFDISVVVNPAYPASTTSVARRSLEQWLASQEQEPVVPEPIAVRRGLLPAAAASMRLTAAILRSKAC